MTDTVTNPSPTIDPTSLLAGELTPARLEQFRKAVFQSVDTVESLRDWLQSPMARGTPRGIALWALGRHEQAIELLEADKKNSAVALCLASSHAALGQLEATEAVLQDRHVLAAQRAVGSLALLS